jgi:hypothetical protein
MFLYSRQKVGRTTRSISSSELIESPNTLLLPLCTSNPEFLATLHDISEDRTAQEDRMLATRRVLDANLEFLYRYNEG